MWNKVNWYVLFNLSDKILHLHPIYSKYLRISKSIQAFKHKQKERTRKKRLTTKMGSKVVVLVYLIFYLCAAIFVTWWVAQMKIRRRSQEFSFTWFSTCWSRKMLVVSLQCPRMCVRNLQLIFSGNFENVEAACCKAFQLYMQNVGLKKN